MLSHVHKKTRELVHVLELVNKDCTGRGYRMLNTGRKRAIRPRGNRGNQSHQQNQCNIHITSNFQTTSTLRTIYNLTAIRMNGVVIRLEKDRE